jgi:hypothetical protein
MNASHLSRMIAAETRTVFSRPSARAALALALLVGFTAIGATGALRDLAASNAAGPEALANLSGVGAGGWALQARNFFVLPLLLVLSAAASVAGELSDHTMRELAGRPVPRWSILLVKLASLACLSALTLVLTALPALGLGVAMFGAAAEAAPGLLDVVGGYLATFLSDVGLLLLAMLLSLFVRSVGGVVVTLTLLLLADLGLRGLLALASSFGAREADALRPWTLGNALGCWEGWSGGYDPQRFLALAVFSVVAAAASVARFRSMDVP